MAVVRAIDVGYGNAKYTLGSANATIRCGMFPSVTCWSASDPVTRVIGERRNTVAVQVDGMYHEVGPDIGAARGRYRASSMHDGYVDAPEYKALVKAALHYIGVDDIDILVLGLPVRSFVARRAALERAWSGTHETTRDQRVRVHQVRVFAQPQGALAWYAMSTGSESVTKRELNLVIDPGSRTFDWLVSRGMTLVQGQRSSTDRGMFDIARTMAEQISKEIGEHYEDHDAIDLALRTRQPLVLYQPPLELKRFAKIADKVAQEAVSRMLEHLRDLASIQNVVLVGGGADIFRKAVKAAFPKHRITDLKEPIFANVRGFQIAGEQLAGKLVTKDRPTAPVAGEGA
jgi:plasmid segregation protein ParM